MIDHLDNMLRHLFLRQIAELGDEAQVRPLPLRQTTELGRMHGPLQRFLVVEVQALVRQVELAERVPVGMGDRVYVRGLYEWNDLGGLLHWTHRDPLADGEGGWVRYRRKTYA